ncbi:MAG: sugar nucleotide-binding protein, partial [Bdellovibrionaceae bacterium]|nr:sugar nucleotide-binding protein [Bdellovibrio sp.]
STDCVFDGKIGNYSENSIASASDHYGQSKFLGEASGVNCLTLRLSIIGREILSKTELVEWFLSQKGKAVNGYGKVYYTGLTTRFVANEVNRIIEKFPTLTGLYQVAAEKISKYELLKLINQKLNNQAELNNDSNKKSDKSLNCDLYVAKTGFKKPTWDEMISDLQSDNSFYEART